jgi:zinc transporter
MSSCICFSFEFSREANTPFSWHQLEQNHSDTENWLKDTAGLEPVVIEALTEYGTNPRMAHHSDGLLLILRGVNMNPGADVEDMVTLRIWIDPSRIITVFRRPVMAVQDLRKEIEEGFVPDSPSDILNILIEKLANRVSVVYTNLAECMDDYEEHILTTKDFKSLRNKINQLRRQLMHLKRYLTPQKDTLTLLYNTRSPLFQEEDTLYLRENAERFARHVNDLDLLRERGMLIREELDTILTEQMNKNMYLLSIITAICLPLSIFTGMLGMNVGGLPGAEHPSGFLITCGVMGATLILELAILRLIRWL